MAGIKKSSSELGRITPDEYAAGERSKVVLVVDSVRSLHNVGSFFRTADAFDIEAVWLCGITATPPNRDIHKTALGAELNVEWRSTSAPTHSQNCALRDTDYTAWSRRSVR